MIETLSKPSVGMFASAGGGVAGLLTYLQWITPAIGFCAAAVGLATGIVTLMIKWREWRKG